MSKANPPQPARLFHHGFGVRVEILDWDAYLSGYGTVKVRRLQDGKELSVPFAELEPVEPLSEKDQPRQLFEHEGAKWRDPAD